jgi:carbonic anhydrase/acetyltransferase-like protein (isoleucine patch superfamily)
MPLSYLRDDCHKQAATHIRESQRFESMYILQGKTQPTRQTLSMLDLRMVSDHTSHVVRVGQPFTSPHKVETNSYTQKKS